MKTLVLDFDGTIRADYYPLTGQWPAEDAARLEARELRRYRRFSADVPDGDPEPHEMLVRPRLVDRINTIAGTPELNVVWLTGAGWLVPRVFAPALGFLDFPNAAGVTDEPGQPASPGNGWMATGWWKNEAIRKLIADPEHQVMWVDDSLYPDLLHHMGMRQPTKTPNLSYIQPDGRLGLSDRELRAIESWATTGYRIALSR